MTSELPRCAWSTSHPLLTQYHDEEWGVPVRDDRRLFELLTLEGAQAGLNWLTVLKKRENYRAAFVGFDAKRVARFTDADIDRLLLDEGLVRHRQKIASVIDNARALLALGSEFPSFAAYLWRFVEDRPIVNTWRSLREIPSATPLSDALSKDMKRRGFRFVGSTTCYAFMQAVGLVDDHTKDCWRRRPSRSART